MHTCGTGQPHPRVDASGSPGHVRGCPPYGGLDKDVVVRAALAIRADANTLTGFPRLEEPLVLIRYERAALVAADDLGLAMFRDRIMCHGPPRAPGVQKKNSTMLLQVMPFDLPNQLVN